VEKEQEAQLRAKFPAMKGPGTSALLQKRLSQKVRGLVGLIKMNLIHQVYVQVVNILLWLAGSVVRTSES